MIWHELESSEVQGLVILFLSDIRMILISLNFVDIKLNFRINDHSVGSALTDDQALLAVHILNNIEFLFHARAKGVQEGALMLEPINLI